MAISGFHTSNLTLIRPKSKTFSISSYKNEHSKSKMIFWISIEEWTSGRTCTKLSKLCIYWPGHPLPPYIPLPTPPFYLYWMIIIKLCLFVALLIIAGLTSWRCWQNDNVIMHAYFLLSYLWVTCARHSTGKYKCSEIFYFRFAAEKAWRSEVMGNKAVKQAKSK